jgi:UPF0755 protein
MKKFKYLIYIAPIFLFIIFFILYSYYVTYNKPNISKDTSYLYIHSNAKYQDIIDSLKSNDILKNYRSFSRAAKKMNLETSFKPGRYKLTEGMSNKQVINRILLNDQSPVNLIIAGSIRNREKLAKIIAKKIECEYDVIYSALNNDSVINSYGFNKNTFISMFMPYTYEVYWTTSVNDLFDKFKKSYDTFWNSERVEKAKELNMSKTEIATLASIVYEESKAEEEQPIIAGVYINRIKKGVPLQADPTVIFALNDYTIRRVLKKHLEVKSPYNTYRIKGLPPGPISIAPIATLDAVLNYKKHKFMYFCASPEFNGRHLFAESLEGHNKNALAYRRALNSRNIKK